MEEFKGTPGPWMVTTWSDATFSNVASSIYQQIDAGKGYFDEHQKSGFSLFGYMNEHDANLIAAAPELLEALQECLPWVNNGIARGAHNKAIAAINKALGK